jgi:hypothetical protein
MPSLWYNPALAMDPAVQKELNLSPTAVSKIQVVISGQALQMGPALQSLMGSRTGASPSQAEASRVMPIITAGFEKMQKACVDNMSAAQLIRLHQITLQSFGPKSLLDPKVGNQVGLSAAQETRLRSELAKQAAVLQAEARKVFTGSKQGQGAAQAMTQASRKKTDALVATILTSKQLAKWKAMQGKPFHLTGFSALFGGG